MAEAPITIKLRCNSWGQLATMYQRDLTRSALFLKANKLPPIGTNLRINLSLPSETLIILAGSVAKHVPPGGLNGRGPGVEVQLHNVPQSAMWLIESALASARTKENSSIRVLPQGATKQATRQRRAPPTQRPGQTKEVSLDAGASLVEAEGDLVGALKQELASLRKLNPFQVLDVGYDTTDQTVRAAFGKLTKRYHPDRFAKYQSREARTLASEIFILIRDAYRRIGSPQVRAQTLKALRQRAAVRSGKRRPTPRATPTQPATASAAQPAPSAPRTPQRTPAPQRSAAPPRTPPLRRAPAQRAPTPRPPTPAPSAITSTDLFGEDEVVATSEPIALQSTRRAHHGDHAKAASLVDEGNFEAAFALYSMAAKRMPGDSAARAGVELCAGLRALAEADRLEAAQRFEAVLELDPTNERAARELAEMRRQATNDRKGLLARLLGKKE